MAAVLVKRSIPSVPIPSPSRAFVGHLSSRRSRQWGNLSENLCLGVGHLSILPGAANSVLFLVFHLKYAYIDSYRHFYEEFFNTYALL